jgi:putative addiction module component (TIGR02574 family)
MFPVWLIRSRDQRKNPDIRQNWQVHACSVGSYNHSCTIWEVAMARSIEDIEKDIRELSRDERRDLLRALIDEFDSPSDPDVEKAWLRVAQRRYQELSEKKTRGVPGPRVFERLRARLSE